MKDGFAIKWFDGSFNGVPARYQGDPALRVIEPWIPVWEEGDPDVVGEGYLVRPEYYPESGYTSDGNQVQAVTTRYATHHGGIAQGPFEAPIGTEIGISALYRHVEGEGVRGDPMVWVGLSFADQPDLVFEATMLTSEASPASYDVWGMAHHRCITIERMFYVVLFTHWRWRAALNCTLWDKAILTYTLPERRPELGGVIRLPWSGGVLRITYEFEAEE